MLNVTMEMRKNILAKFDGVCLEGVLTELNWEDVIIDNMKGVPYHIASGVSKCVFMFKDFPNLVVKIPFTGSGTKNEDEYEYDNEKPYEDFYCASFGCGGHKLKRKWDYCEAEATVYKDAVASGVSDFFAETVCIGEIDNHPIYVQEIATIYYDVYFDYECEYSGEDQKKNRSSIMEKSNNSLSEDDCWIVGQTWLAAFIEEYGTIAAINLITFLKDEGVDDLHSENLGFIDDKQVIVDYASFNN